MATKYKGILGRPIYKHKDCVRFLFNGKILEGIIGIVDSYGTMEQKREPSYDIEVGGEEIVLYKHIPESEIVCRIVEKEVRKEE